MIKRYKLLHNRPLLYIYLFIYYYIIINEKLKRIYYYLFIKYFNNSATIETLRELPSKEYCCFLDIDSGNEKDAGNPCKLAISFGVKYLK